MKYSFGKLDSFRFLTFSADCSEILVQKGHWKQISSEIQEVVLTF